NAITRRSFSQLLAGGVGLAASARGSTAAALTRHADPKLVFVHLRGGLDGLAAVTPDQSVVFDLRPNLSAPERQRLPLGNGFSLHPSLKFFHRAYLRGEAGFVHACATPYRGRSHFGGQDVLETFHAHDAVRRRGWFAELAQAVPGVRGIAIGPHRPLLFEGTASRQAANWSSPTFGPSEPSVLGALSQLYAEDTLLSDSLATGRAFSERTTSRHRAQQKWSERKRTISSFESLGQMMAGPDGFHVGTLSLSGWDTHAEQKSPLTRRLADLDAGLETLRRDLGPDWQNTIVIAVSEFGRTVRENGSRGSDHGTAGVMLLLGGALRGGRMFGDWPGLGRRQLFDQRDLYPVNAVGEILGTVFSEHLGADPDLLARTNQALAGADQWRQIVA
ncbi:MAG: DUF1501 domain-containing protein, partial [Pseudomonadota bacterium]